MLTTILDLLGMACTIAALVFLVLVLLPWPWNVFCGLLLAGVLITAVSLFHTTRGGAK